MNHLCLVPKHSAECTVRVSTVKGISEAWQLLREAAEKRADSPRCQRSDTFITNETLQILEQCFCGSVSTRRMSRDAVHDNGGQASGDIAGTDAILAKVFVGPIPIEKLSPRLSERSF